MSVNSREATRSAFPGVRLHVVTGKGGTGKTTVAAATALSLANGGKRVILVEVEGRQGIAQLFDTPPLPHEETRIAVADGGGEVWALAVDPTTALLEYLEMFYNLRRAGTALRKMGAIDFVTTIAPGLRDVLLTGKAIELVRRVEKSQPNAFDAVVLDAPPTGRITRFLNVNAEVSGLAKVGPIRNQADSVMAVLRSPRTAVHVVTVLEEMPIQEAVDGIAELTEAQLPVGGVIVNMTQPRELHAVPSREALAAALADAGLTGARASEEVLTALLTEGHEYLAREMLESRERALLATLDHPIFELPLISGGIDLGALYELAADLRRQGLS